MTSLDYGLDMPYEVQLEHHASTTDEVPNGGSFASATWGWAK